MAGAIITYERVPEITRFLDTEGTGVTYEQLIAAAVKDIKEMAAQPSRDAYEKALKARTASQAGVRARFGEHRIVALAYPTTFEPAPKLATPAR